MLYPTKRVMVGSVESSVHSTLRSERFFYKQPLVADPKPCPSSSYKSLEDPMQHQNKFKSPTNLHADHLLVQPIQWITWLLLSKPIQWSNPTSRGKHPYGHLQLAYHAKFVAHPLINFTMQQKHWRDPHECNRCPPRSQGSMSSWSAKQIPRDCQIQTTAAPCK